MANITRNFTKGRMNKSTDKRLIQDGEYIDALNVRVNSTEGNEVGSVENSLGNTSLTTLTYTDGTALSVDAKCIGAYEDGSNERLIWFVHDPSFTVGATGKLDMIVSYDTKTSFLQYHVISIDDGGGVDTTLNFNPQYLITGVDLVDENLLYFTDDYNPPRKINLDRSYSFPVSNIDDFSDESILVIKKPPVTSPDIEMIDIGQDINYIEDRFLCFAYRYRYADNEYSATSQFSEPAFFPKDFDFSADSLLNDGMQNKFNAAIINFNTGSELVVGIDLLYKDANDPIIRVIEKINKKDSGYSDNTDYTYLFDNSKIYTILPDSEILRLYDNVPKFAKAQTIMSNRLVYGNYKDGYDLVDENGNDVKFNYFTDLVSEDIRVKNILTGKENTVYNIDGLATVSNGIVSFDLSPLNPNPTTNLLKAGTSIEFGIEFLHATYTGIASPMPTVRNSFQVSFIFNLNNDYSSVYQLATSAAFLNKVGTAANILPVYDLSNPTSCSGTTFTDIYNCAVPTISSYTKYRSGVNSAGDGIEIISSPSSKEIKMKFPAMNYVADPANPTVDYLWDYFSVDEADSQFYNTLANRSLHSNRDYDIAISYMDDFNRATTPSVSKQNTEHIRCGLSDKKNSIKVTIPSTQKPPFWATRYKFLIKPDKDSYETIYSQFYYEEAGTGYVYFLLEGENARKVEEGDRYIVKTDTNGVVGDCVIATVLEKKAQAKDFITPKVPSPIPAGVYMKISASDFGTTKTTSPVWTNSGSAKSRTKFIGAKITLNCGTNTSDVEIKVNSKIEINFSYSRIGTSSKCEQRSWNFSQTYVSSADYNNMYDWFIGDGIQSTIDTGTRIPASGPDCPPRNKFFPGIYPGAFSVSAPDPDYCENRWFFARLPGSGGAFSNILQLVMTTTTACGGSNSKLVAGKGSITIYQSDSTVIFETQPKDSLPDVFYESSESFAITNGLHQGNVQNQTTGQSAIINTDFFNCFSFGNGAESYKILDSISGRQFNLGNRVMSVAAEDYKEAHRFADLTYSGVFNDETNINKLNEFNLGLLNFKPLEESFGTIQKLDGKKTNVLVLQEDKISYVLAGKNILSDAGGGSALTSVPEVLGQQVTKTEEYGISHNPESYAKWGYDKFFTDAKRGVVLQLRGNDETAGDQVKVISEMGMRSWFRDLFIDSFNTQKLGGFDPYSNEYVLSSNEELLPSEVGCSDCSDYRTFDVQSGNDYEYCINVGTIVGFTEVKWNISAGLVGTITVDVVYNGVTYTSGAVSTAGSISVPKSLTGVTQFDITVSTTGSARVEVNTACPDANNINVRWIVISSRPGTAAPAPIATTGLVSNDGSGDSPIYTDRIQLIEGEFNPNVSSFTEFSGAQGSGVIPTDDSEVTMLIQKNQSDSFEFNPDTNRFMYLRTEEVYENNQSDVEFLLDNATTASGIAENDEYFSSTFAMPEEGSNLYLIWDLRTKNPLFLSYSDIDASDACCGYNCDAVTSEYTIVSSHEQIVFFTYYDAFDVLVEDNISQGEVKVVCSSTLPTTVGTFTDVEITFTRCGCSS